MKSLKELERVWYKKLERTGFRDIEDTSREDRPLRSWHGEEFTKPAVVRRREQTEAYYATVSDLLHHPQFDWVCDKVAMLPRKHKITAGLVRSVWEWHVEGLSIRETAKRANITARQTQRLVEAMRKWITLL